MPVALSMLPTVSTHHVSAHSSPGLELRAARDLVYRQVRPASGGLHQEAARIDAVYQIAEGIGEMDRSFERIVRIAAQMLGTPWAALSLVAEEQTMPKVVIGLPADAPSPLLPLERITAATNMAYVIEDLEADELYMHWATARKLAPPAMYAGVPVRTPTGLVVGVLSVADQIARPLTEAELAALADLGATIEELILLRSASIVDVVTGLFNRRYFEELVAKEWRRSLRQSTPISVLLIDIDFFKALNDALGHAEGDRALANVARLLREQFRRGGDVVARYGGEEFVVVLPDTDAAGAMELARAACRYIEDAGLVHPTSPYEALTVSVGVATASTRADQERGPIALLSRADQALYEAKRQGRNRAVFDKTAAHRGI
ncbi:sensor domain-containing diguanylate cyclase [Fontimonas sp. SYSU GA230001]|uniref:GGDEF domain-containing protein n=1 Tax=Fontimonas sp. SYSU GA230001 TaxID=3142450 RepID=UPI0032B45F76